MFLLPKFSLKEKSRSITLKVMPNEPKEIFRKLRYSLIERLQYPSAILRCTESTDAICCEATRFSSKGKDRKTSHVKA
jgi:hypothetical protein